MESIENDSILILGASSDIGCEVIKALDNKGLTIFAHYNKSISKIKRLQAEVDANIIPVRADFSNEKEIYDLIHFVDKRSVNLSKIVHLSAPKILNVRFKEIRWVDFQKNIDIQLKPAVLTLNHFLPLMAKKKHGKVVFILSSITINIPPMALSHYITTKYALLGLMRSLASEYANKKLNINAISPSMVETDFLSEIPKKIIEITADQHPLKRNANPKDIAPLVKFLLSDESAYITGANIPVSGGSAF